MTGGHKKIYFLTADCPYPGTGGGKIRDQRMIQLLREHGPVEVICQNEPKPGAILPADVTIRAITKKSVPMLAHTYNWLRPHVVHGYCPEVANVLKTIAQQSAAQSPILWVSKLGMAQYIPCAKALGYKVILDNHSVESMLSFEESLTSIKNWIQIPLALQCAYYEKKYCELADIAIAASDIDAAKLTNRVPKKSFCVLPNTVDPETYATIKEQVGKTLFFSGTLSYPPNIEGLEWFVSEILPRLKAAMGSTMPRVVVAGSNPPASLIKILQGSGIEIFINPATMEPLLKDTAVFFIPLKNGSGTRLKTLQAMAAGRAIVSTGKGTEGLVLTPSHDIFIADQEDAFTSAIVRLLRDSNLQKTIGLNAVETIRIHYDWRGLRPKVKTLVDELRR